MQMRRWMVGEAKGGKMANCRASHLLLSGWLNAPWKNDNERTIAPWRDSRTEADDSLHIRQFVIQPLENNLFALSLAPSSPLQDLSSMLCLIGCIILHATMPGTYLIPRVVPRQEPCTNHNSPNDYHNNNKISLPKHLWTSTFTYQVHRITTDLLHVRLWRDYWTNAFEQKGIRAPKPSGPIEGEDGSWKARVDSSLEILHWCYNYMSLSVYFNN